MPPIYGYFIYLHTIFFGIGQSLVISVIISQIIISSFTPIIFYKITSTFFNKNLSLIGALIFSLFPIIVFSASQISSVTIYLFLLLIFFYFFLEFCSSQAYRLAVLIAVISGILILTRRDFVLIYFFSIFFSYFFFKVNLKKILFIIMITIITISPYLIKNYLVFDKIIIHSGFGYNVWKAYNPNAKAEGYYIQSDDLKIKLDKIEKNVFYRINEDKVYLTKAKHYIKDEPSKYFKLFLNRIFSYYFIDLNSSQTNYFNQFHVIPNIVFAILSIAGIIVFNKKNFKYNYLILTMFLIIFIYSCFAILPRYKIYILPFQILLSLNLLEYFIEKLSKKN